MQRPTLRLKVVLLILQWLFLGAGLVTRFLNRDDQVVLRRFEHLMYLWSVVFFCCFIYCVIDDCLAERKKKEAGS